MTVLFIVQFNLGFTIEKLDTKKAEAFSFGFFYTIELGIK